ncbi:MAG: amidase [Candidatus Geothermincolia bacterium]
MAVGDFAFMDATAQAELVRRKEVSPKELLQAAIDRIERVNPQLNAIITPMYEEAGATVAAGLPDGPFKGVPFLLKDLIAGYAGVRMASGSRWLSDHICEQDSGLVSRLKRAGLVILGKTNAPEFGIMATTEPVLFGPTRNPWDLERIPGGSSGGSAAAVAAGLVPMAHGNDFGGSIRIPSSCCGLFGLKPTRARNPMGPAYGDMVSGFWCEHALTRSVRDSAALLDATCGPSACDPYCAPALARPFLQEVGTPPGALRIAVMRTSPTGFPVHEDCIAAVDEAAKLCEGLGHSVEEIALDVDAMEITQSYVTVFAAGAAWFIDLIAEETGRKPSQDRFEPLTWGLYEMATENSSSHYLQAITRLQRISRDVTLQTAAYDAVLTPTLSEPPPLLGTFDSSPDMPLEGLLKMSEFVPFTVMSNFMGTPAMNVPLNWNEAGLPVGTQFIGRFGDEATLFRLAAQLEQARPWAGRRPPVSA